MENKDRALMNVPRDIILLLIFLLSSLAGVFATGVQPSQPEAPTRTIVDARGRSVSITANPERIVIAGSATLMVADAFYVFESAAGRVVGITRIGQARGNFLPEIDDAYDEKVVLERNVGPEQIAALSPDVVILKSFMKERLGDGVEQLGIPVIYVDFETPENYGRDLAILGSILQEPARADQIARYYADAVDAVTARTAAIPADQRPDVLFLYASPTGAETAFNIPPESWIQTTLVELAGGQPVWTESNPGSGWLTVGLEQIAAWDPDKIVLVAYRDNPEEIRAALLQQGIWQSLKAVQTGEFHVFPVDFYSWDQPDTRWALGLQWLATKIQPELFNDINMTQVVYGFFELLYGMDRATTDELILNELGGDLD